MLQEAAEEVLTYLHFPQEHWRQLHSTNPLERLNRELARRFDVVAIFPNPQAVLRLLGAVLEEIHEEWMASRRYFSSTVHAQAAPGGRTRCGPGCSPRGVSPGRL
jgi:transposase-like protein